MKTKTINFYSSVKTPRQLKVVNGKIRTLDGFKAKLAIQDETVISLIEHETFVAMHKELDQLRVMVGWV